MHRHSIRLAVVATAIAGSAAAQQPLKEMARPCVAIREACQQAGFVKQGARAGEGLIIDCIRPIMLGGPQPRRAARPLPPIDPQIVAACRTRNAKFGFGGGPERRPAGTPGEAGPMPRPMRPGQPQAPAAVTPHAPATGAPNGPPAPQPSATAPAETPAVPSAAGPTSPTPTAPSETAPPATPPNAPPAPPPAAASPGPPQTPAVPHGENKRPKIVFVLAEDLSMNLVRDMPHVLDMQKAGVTFDNYFVTDSLCCPSRASFFTGRYPHNTGIFRNTFAGGGYQAFRSRGHEGATFASALATVGYRAAMLGKYLDGYQPERDPAAPGWTTWAVAGNGEAEFDYALNHDRQVVHYGNALQDYLTDVLADHAVEFIKQSAGTPFMLEVATFAPHTPHMPAPRDANSLRG